MANEGINHLGRVLQGRMKEVGYRPPFLDFGEIQDDMSLLTNQFPCPIPQKDYVVCRSVQWGAVDDIFYKTLYPLKENSGIQHVHNTLIGPKFRWLQPGDRVLVAWVGDDACVIDIIYPATRIGRDADGYDK